MEQLVCSTVVSGRELRKVITGLLLSGAVEEVKRLQYVKSYRRGEGKKILSQEEKLLVLFFAPEQKAKVVAMLGKFPMVKVVEK